MTKVQYNSLIYDMYYKLVYFIIHVNSNNESNNKSNIFQSLKMLIREYILLSYYTYIIDIIRIF